MAEKKASYVLPDLGEGPRGAAGALLGLIAPEAGNLLRKGLPQAPQQPPLPASGKVPSSDPMYSHLAAGITDLLQLAMPMGGAAKGLAAAGAMGMAGAKAAKAIGPWSDNVLVKLPNGYSIADTGHGTYTKYVLLSPQGHPVLYKPSPTSLIKQGFPDEEIAGLLPHVQGLVPANPSVVLPPSAMKKNVPITQSGASPQAVVSPGKVTFKQAGQPGDYMANMGGKEVGQITKIAAEHYVLELPNGLKHTFSKPEDAGAWLEAKHAGGNMAPAGPESGLANANVGELFPGADLGGWKDKPFSEFANAISHMGNPSLLLKAMYGEAAAKEMLANTKALHPSFSWEGMVGSSLSDDAISAALKKNPAASIMDVAGKAQESPYDQYKKILTTLPRDAQWSMPSRATEGGYNVQAHHGTGLLEGGKKGLSGVEGNEFSGFRLPYDEIGVHFGSPRAASEFAAPDYGTARVFPTALRANNPLEMKDLGTWYLPKIVNELDRLGFPKDEVGALNSIQDARTYIASKGYDSIKYQNKVEDPGHMSHILFQAAETNPRYVSGARVPWAKFDPKAVGSHDLLAGVTGGGMMVMGANGVPYVIGRDEK